MAESEKKQGKGGASSARCDEGSCGVGGETHQTVQNTGAPALTSMQGVPIADGQNSLLAGLRGPTLLEDFVLREKIFHFDHERIPERVVHARGYGAHGYFETYESLSDITCADIFQRAGEKTEAFVRFSTVVGSKGSPDLARDVRGFAVKLYTREGNWDIVGNNIPVFFVQDATKFPDLVHAAKPEPDTDFPQAQTAHDNFWDFVSLMPESTHMLMWVMSGRALPRSYRFMEGFGVHTFRFVNAKGAYTNVKFIWKPQLALQSVVWDEAMKINGADPDFHRRDLYESIARGEFPTWELGIQIFDDATAATFPFDILDPTKLVPEELVPVRRVGRLVLTRMPENFFAETEQVAFCTQNIVRGIDFTNDPLLQGRNFSYLDTQLSRLGGPNFTHIPINAPRCPVRNFFQDGHMAIFNPRGRANYEPNSWCGDEQRGTASACVGRSKGESEKTGCEKGAREAGKGAKEKCGKMTSAEGQERAGRAAHCKHVPGGPREDAEHGFRSLPGEPTDCGKLRARSATFADHYSQARQFYISQTETEQKQIVGGFVFELSKVKREDLRTRMLSRLVNVDASLVAAVAAGLGMPVPAAAPPVRPVLDLPPSKALSILLNGPSSLAGRVVGVLVGDGCDAALLAALRGAVEGVGGRTCIVCPTVGGVTLSDGTRIKGDEKVDGGPSVLFDACVLLLSAESAATMARMPPAQQWVSLAFAHMKRIAYTAPSRQLLTAAGITADQLDEGFTLLESADDISTFAKIAHERFWAREKMFAQ
eukprot:m.248957 g.248957  ORF g.248957 m.248957 type:complete len:766 (-) comp63856_c0_seq1:49-2346(-)